MEISDLRDNRVELHVLIVEVRSLIKIHMSAIPAFMPLFVHLKPLLVPKEFELFMKDNGPKPIVGTKRGRERYLQDPNILFNQFLKWARRDS